MGTIARKSDGRRIFTDEFKRQQIERVWRGEVTLSDLSRKLGIAPSLLHRWKRLLSTAPARRGAPGPARALRADQYIRELQLLLGKQTVEIELLRAELSAIKSKRSAMKKPPR